MGRKQRISERIRFEVIQRDNGRCRACGIGDIDALQADHIIPTNQRVERLPLITYKHCAGYAITANKIP